MTDKLKYALDTEFLEDGHTIELISIALVCEDGHEYYAVNSDMDVNRIRRHDWLMANVIPSLPCAVTSSLDGREQYINLDRRNSIVKPRWVIANEVRDFLVGNLTPVGERDGHPLYFDSDMPELWADHGAYDHVALAQLWGRMIDLPAGIPMWTHDIQQAIETTDGYIGLVQEDGLHNALEDARHLMRVMRALGVVQ